MIEVEAWIFCTLSHYIRQLLGLFCGFSSHTLLMRSKNSTFLLFSSTCQKGIWKCTDNVCYGTCMIYGSGHYNTFDGKFYDFDGSCEYVATQVMLIRRAEMEFDCLENLLSSLVLSFLIACHHCSWGVHTFCQDKLCIFSAGKLCECGFFFSDIDIINCM